MVCQVLWHLEAFVTALIRAFVRSHREMTFQMLSLFGIFNKAFRTVVKTALDRGKTGWLFILDDLKRFFQEILLVLRDVIGSYLVFGGL
jgi:hypothetical protein